MESHSLRCILRVLVSMVHAFVVLRFTSVCRRENLPGLVFQAAEAVELKCVYLRSAGAVSSPT
jgi:hypothetical protein